MSLFSSLSVGVTGLHAAQTSINTASHNLANAQTKGYTRQSEIITDLTYNTLGMGGRNALKQVGLGTQVELTRQIRDQFLDKEYRLENGREKFYETQYQTAVELQDLFGEMEGVEFADSLESFWNVCQELQKDPANIVNRELFISCAESFVETAQTLSKTLNEYQLSLNDEIEAQVKRINQIGEEINALNLQIIKAEIGNVQANDLRDARNLLMDELSDLTYYTYEEDSNGAINIWIENAPLVDGGLSFHMATQRIEESFINEDGDEETYRNQLYTVVWTDNGCGEVYDMSKAYSYAQKTDVGSLRAILTARGQKVANYTDMPVKPDEAEYTDEDGTFDEEGYLQAMYAYNKEVEAYNNGVGASIITRIQAEFDQLIHGVTTAINDIFCPNIEIELDASITADDGTVFEAGTYKMLDLYNCPVGVDDDATVGEEVFTRGATPRYTIVDVPGGFDFPVTGEDGKPVLDEDGNPKTITVYQLYIYKEESDLHYEQYSLAELSVNQKLLQNYSYLPVKSNPNTGDFGAYDMNKTFTKILNVWDEKFAVLDPNTLTSYTFSEYYNAMIGDLGTQGGVWKSIMDSQTTLTETTEDKRQNVSGVSTDEELTELIKFQYCYRSASRYITVVDEMINQLVSQLGS